MIRFLDATCEMKLPPNLHKGTSFHPSRIVWECIRDISHVKCWEEQRRLWTKPATCMSTLWLVSLQNSLTLIHKQTNTTRKFIKVFFQLITELLLRTTLGSALRPGSFVPLFIPCVKWRFWLMHKTTHLMAWIVRYVITWDGWNSLLEATHNAQPQSPWRKPTVSEQKPLFVSLETTQRNSCPVNWWFCVRCAKAFLSVFVLYLSTQWKVSWLSTSPAEMSPSEQWANKYKSTRFLHEFPISR